MGRVIFFIVFLDLIGFGIILPFVPLYVGTMGGGAKTVGLLFATFSFAQLVCGPILGRLSDRFGRRPVILASLFGNAVAMGGFAMATHLSMLSLLFFSRALAGATAGNIAACQAALADISTEEERPHAMGRIGAAVGMGMIFGPLLGSRVSPLGPAAPPLLAAALGVAAWFAAFFFIRETRPAEGATTSTVPAPETSPEPTLRQTLRDKNVWLILLMFFCLYLGIPAMNVGLSLVSRDRLHWGEEEVGHAFGLFGAIMFFIQAANLVGRSVRRFGPLSVLVGSGTLAAAGMFAIAVAHAPATLLFGIVLIATGFSMANPVLATLAATRAGEKHRGVILGLSQSSGGLARTVGPALAGTLYDHVGTGAPFVGASIASLLSVFFATRMPKTLPNVKAP